MDWHVDDLDAALERLAAMGAAEYGPMAVWEKGFVTASVLGPFGKVPGPTHNSHCLDVLGRVRALPRHLEKVTTRSWPGGTISREVT